MGAVAAAEELEALQRTLAAEHAAVHLLGLLGAQTSQSAQPERFALVVARHAVHRGRRDQLVEAVRAQGAEPVAAEAAYQLPSVETPARVARVGVELERDCAAVYAALVGASVDDGRQWALDALVESALAALEWGGTPESFPGAAEL